MIRTRLIGEAPIVVNGDRADVLLTVDVSQCHEPPVRRQRLRMMGIYNTGFEVSSFLPCTGMPAEADYYEESGFYWADMPTSLHKTILSRGSTLYGNGSTRTLYVEWLGTATGPGQYGHMGMALYQLDVDTLYKVSSQIPATCRPKGLERFLPRPPPPPPAERTGDGRLHL